MANPKGNPQNLLAWKPGQSGNPAGRPKGLNSLLREKYGDDAKVLVEELGRLAFDKRESPSARFRMLAYLIDQHSGRPAQAVSRHRGRGRASRQQAPRGDLSEYTAKGAV